MSQPDQPTGLRAADVGAVAAALKRADAAHWYTAHYRGSDHTVRYVCSCGLAFPEVEVDSDDGRRSDAIQAHRYQAMAEAALNALAALSVPRWGRS